VPERHFVKYSFLKVDPAWRRLDAQQRAAGPQGGIEAGLRQHVRPQPFARAQADHERCHAAAGRGHKGPRQLAAGQVLAQDRAFGGGDDPRVGGVIVEEHRDDVAVDETAEAIDRGGQDLLEIERRRQRLGHPVEGHKEVVRLRELAHPVEGEGVLLLHLPEDPAGVPGEQGHEHQLDGPLAGEAEALGGEQAEAGVEGNGDGDAGGRRGPEARPETAEETDGHDPAEQAEDERRAPRAGGDDGGDRHRQTGKGR